MVKEDRSFMPSHIRVAQKRSAARMQFIEWAALVSTRKNASTAAIFLHGFNGNLSTTWSEFPKVVVGDQGSPSFWVETDAYFLGYPSVRAGIAKCTIELEGWITRVLPGPAANFLAETCASEPVKELLRTRQYKKIILIGHSMGGVVLRNLVVRSLRDAVALSSMRKGRKNRSVPLECPSEALRLLVDAELRLLAPALSGARPAGLFGIARQLGLAKLMAWSPSYAELIAPEVGPIANIRLETERLASLSREVRSLRADLLWAAEDKVVAVTEYSCDATGVVISGVTHTSICKVYDDSSIAARFVAGQVMGGAPVWR